MSKKTKGQGVGAMFETGGLRMDPRNVKRREQAAARRAEIAKARAEDGLPPKPRKTKFHNLPLETAFDPDPPRPHTPRVTSKPMTEDARAARASVDYAKAVTSLGPGPRGPSPVSDAAWVFEEACTAVISAQSVLDAAVAKRAKARQALDNAANRLADGDAS